jgi:hypothetical protein
MSLKAFHVVFVVASTLCALGFGAWSVAAYTRTGAGGALAMSIGAFAAAAVLVWYGFWFLRKLKNVSFL